MIENIFENQEKRHIDVENVVIVSNQIDGTESDGLIELKIFELLVTWKVTTDQSQAMKPDGKFWSGRNDQFNIFWQIIETKDLY